MRTASRRAALWILALLVPSAYSVAAGEVGRALAAPQTQRTQTTASVDDAVTWDFETGDLRGWTPVGTAFAFQPTRGDSPRSRQSASNHQGAYWIGTYERYQGRRGETVGDFPTRSAQKLHQNAAEFLNGSDGFYFWTHVLEQDPEWLGVGSMRNC